MRCVVILDHYFGLTVNDFAESFLENTGKYFIYLSRNSISNIEGIPLWSDATMV